MKICCCLCLLVGMAKRRAGGAQPMRLALHCPSQGQHAVDLTGWRQLSLQVGGHLGAPGGLIFQSITQGLPGGLNSQWL